MPIVAARLDYRLLHGIVQGFWCPTYATQRTMIIDDDTSNDEIRKSAMKLSKPSGQALSIINHETAFNNFKAGKYDNHTVFVIAKDAKTFLDLINLGQSIPILTLGLTEPHGDEISGKQISRRVFIKDDDLDIYKAIAKSGTKIEVRYMTTDKPVPLEDCIQL